jgi:hypothetical protein
MFGSEHKILVVNELEPTDAQSSANDEVEEMAAA